MVLAPLPKHLLPNRPVFHPPLDHVPAFGHECRQLYGFRDGFRTANQGAYGATPLCVLEASFEWARIAEQSPDLFYKRQFQAEVNRIRALLAKVMNADQDDVVVVPSASAGNNIFIRSLPWSANDTVISFNTAYGSVERLLAWTKDAYGIHTDVIDLAYPISDDNLLKLLRERILKLIGQGRNVKMCVFDAISSNPGVRMPWERIIALLKEYTILSLVDAAHAIGQIPIDLRAAKPDFFVTNVHKWFMAHRTVAALYVDKKHQSLIQTIPTSYTYLESGKDFVPGDLFSSDNAFVTAFEWPGTQDMSRVLSVDIAAAFRDWLGGDNRIMAYNHDLAKAGGRKVAAMLGTDTMEVLDPSQQTELVGSMINVRLPCSQRQITGKVAVEVARRLFEDYNCFAQPFVFGGQMWVRLSAQIFLDITDFEYIGKALKEILGTV